VPTETKNGTKINPVMIICATFCFITALVLVFWLIAEYPEQADVYIRPIIPSLVTLGAALVLYLRSYKNNEDNKAGMEVAKETAVEVAEKAAVAVQDAQIAVVESNERLNGELDQRIENAVTRALITQKEE